MAKKSSYRDPEADDGGNAFAALLKAKGLVAESATPLADARPGSKEPPRTATTAGPGWCRRKLVVRRERKGRRGKTVVIVSGLGAAEPELGQLARRIRKALGTGSNVEGADIVVMGDIPDRVVAWLEKAGATRVIRGS